MLQSVSRALAMQDLSMIPAAAVGGLALKSRKVDQATSHSAAVVLLQSV